jgi:aspartyl-tRNA(Asn)/glutamyl-tRNA(Gln) amidotransferase subunit C
MTKVTPDTVEHVARLAQLSLTAEERATFARQLDDVLAYAESIQALDTSGVEPMSHASGVGLLREDRPQPSLDREKVQSEAPDADRGLFRVPRVLGG